MLSAFRLRLLTRPHHTIHPPRIVRVPCIDMVGYTVHTHTILNTVPYNPVHTRSKFWNRSVLHACMHHNENTFFPGKTFTPSCRTCTVFPSGPLIYIYTYHDSTAPSAHAHHITALLEETPLTPALLEYPTGTVSLGETFLPRRRKRRRKSFHRHTRSGEGRLFFLGDEHSEYPLSSTYRYSSTGTVLYHTQSTSDLE